MARLTRTWPLLLTLALLAGFVAACALKSIRNNQGHFVYVLDDPYIHMAVARNLAEHGVWGIDPTGFTAAASSILWPAMIAGSFAVLGDWVMIPFALNGVLAVAVLTAPYAILRRERLGSPWILATLLALTALAPIPALIFTGLEHLLHILLALGLLCLAAERLTEPGPLRRDWPWGWSIAYFALPALLAATRLEGLFMVAVVAGLTLLRRRIVEAIALVASAAVPVVASGLYSLAHGWAFLPSPVLLKGQRPQLDSLDHMADAAGRRALFFIYEQPAVAVLIGLMLVALVLLSQRAAPNLGGRARRASDRRVTWMLWICLGTTMLHMQFAQVGWFYRYEAYLIAMAVVTLALAAARLTRESIPRTHGADAARPASRRVRPAHAAAIGVTLIIAGAPLVSRAYLAARHITWASANIYQQHIQMARFIDTFYPDQVVAMNDIGAAAYLSNARVLDLWGLANIEVSRARLAGTYDRQMIDELVRRHGARIAIVYDPWFLPIGLPTHWHRVGEWDIPGEIGCGYDIVSFYAVDAQSAGRLRDQLTQFADQLPPEVEQRLPARPAEVISLDPRDPRP